MASVDPITADSTLVTFAVPEELRDEFRFEPGQHVTVQMEGVRRNYSICAPATRATLRIAVKHILPHLPTVDLPSEPQSSSRENGNGKLPERRQPLPDEWHGRFVTLDSDWARLTEPDFDEASSRLRRLARTYLLIYEIAGEEAWDASRSPAWTLREIAEHVSGVSAYAEYVGNLR